MVIGVIIERGVDTLGSLVNSSVFWCAGWWRCGFDVPREGEKGGCRKYLGGLLQALNPPGGSTEVGGRKLTQKETFGARVLSKSSQTILVICLHCGRGACWLQTPLECVVRSNPPHQRGGCSPPLSMPYRAYANILQNAHTTHTYAHTMHTPSIYHAHIQHTPCTKDHALCTHYAHTMHTIHTPYAPYSPTILTSCTDHTHTMCTVYTHYAHTMQQTCTHCASRA